MFLPPSPADLKTAKEEISRFQANPWRLTFDVTGEDTFISVNSLFLELQEEQAGTVRATEEIINPSGSPITFEFSGSQMNWPPGKYRLVLSALQPDKDEVSAADLITLAQWDVRLLAHHASLTTAPAPTPITALTAAQASALYATITSVETLQAQVDALGSVDLSAYSTTAQMNTAIGTATDGLAPLASPALTGVPTAPTAASLDSSTQLATTAFVQARIGEVIGGIDGGGTVLNTEPQTLTLTDKDQVLENLGLVNVANIVTLTGTQTLTNKSIDAGQLTGNVAVARIATALTTPGAIGGTTPGAATFSALSMVPASGVETWVAAGNNITFKYATQRNAQYGLYGINLCGDLSITFSSSTTNHASGRDIRMYRYAAGVMGFDDDAGNARDIRVRCVKHDRTDTAAGTTGAQTINKGAGTVNFAAAATSLVVTNSLVTATTKIIATVQTNDTTAKSVAVVAASGSFTLYLNAAATAETAVAWEISG